MDAPEAICMQVWNIHTGDISPLIDGEVTKTARWSG